MNKKQEIKYSMQSIAQLFIKRKIVEYYRIYTAPILFYTYWKQLLLLILFAQANIILTILENIGNNISD